MASHNEVAHAWAHQTGRARKGFNMFYDGATIYSYGYHFPIARIVEDATGNKVCLFTTDRHSVSTAKHITYTRRAIHGVMPVYEVPRIVTEGAWANGENCKDYVKRIEEALAKSKRARVYKEMHLNEAKDLASQLNDYIDAFQIDFPHYQMPADISAHMEALEAARLEEQRKRDEADKEAIQKWLKGEADAAPHTRFPYVRVKGDKVQTSWGVSINLRKALALYRLANRCKSKHHSFVPNKRHDVDGFALGGIAADGTLRVGCHVIPFKAQHMAAELAGLAAH